jgi:hypothetical protein
MKLQALGIEAKNVFHLVGLDSSGQVVIRKRCSRRQVLAFTANVEVQVIGMEACSGAHFLGRALREQGHDRFHYEKSVRVMGVLRLDVECCRKYLRVCARKL